MMFKAFREEAVQKIQKTYRKDADPIFQEIARQAGMAAVRFGSNWSFGAGITLMCPTDHPRGYFALLQWMAKNPDVTQTQIAQHFNNCMCAQLNRLIDGNLIFSSWKPRTGTKGPKKVRHFFISDFGKAYLVGASKNLKSRKVLKSSTSSIAYMFYAQTYENV